MSGPVSFAFFCRFSLLRVVFLKKFSGANFCFWVVVVLVLCFLVGFCLCFCFFLWRLAPESVWKNFFDVRSGFLGGSFSFPLVFSSTSFVFLFFSRDKDQVVTGHPHTHFFACSFSLFVSRRAFCFALFGRASCFSAFFSGCHSGPCAFLGFSRDFSEAFFLDARRQRFRCFSCPCVSFSPSVVFCGHIFSRNPSR